MIHRFISVASLAIALAACSQPVQESSTQSSQALATLDSGARPPHRRPPQAAFDACVSKAVNDACTVAFGDKTINGTCASPPPGATDAATFCRPSGPPPGGPGGHPHGPPPPEAFTACDGKAADNACTVTFGDHTIDGSCRTPPPDSGETRLACAPAHPPPHPL